MPFILKEMKLITDESKKRALKKAVSYVLINPKTGKPTECSFEVFDHGGADDMVLKTKGDIRYAD